MKTKNKTKYFIHPSYEGLEDMLYRLRGKSIQFYLKNGKWHPSFFGRVGMFASFRRTHRPISEAEARQIMERLDKQRIK